MEMLIITVYTMLATGVLTWLVTYLYMKRGCPKCPECPKPTELTPRQKEDSRICSEAKFERMFQAMLAAFPDEEVKKKLVWARNAFKTFWYIHESNCLREQINLMK